MTAPRAGCVHAGHSLSQQPECLINNDLANECPDNNDNKMVPEADPTS